MALGVEAVLRAQGAGVSARHRGRLESLAEQALRTGMPQLRRAAVSRRLRIEGVVHSKACLAGGSQNYPNPFKPATLIHYQIPAAGKVSLKVYGLLGREVAVLADEVQNAGLHTVSFNGASLSSGVYMYRLTAGSLTATRKMVMVK